MALSISYLPAFLKRRGKDKCVLCVAGNCCASMVSLFGDYPVEVFEQKEMEAAVQACIHEECRYILSICEVLMDLKILL